jgi:hypothetical protein
VTDAAVDDLKTLTSLTDLDLSFTKISDAKIAELQKALPKVKFAGREGSSAPAGDTAP